VAYRIKNNSTHAQGLATLDGGKVYVPAGQERTVELADVGRARRFAFLDITELDAKVPAPSPEIVEEFARFDHDGDGHPGGSMPQPTDGQGSFSDEREEEPKPKAATVRRRRKRRARPKAKK
jgi:hypothetical protein